VVLISRDEAYTLRDSVTVTPVTTTIRGLPVEVVLGPEDGLPRRCVANTDNITTIRIAALAQRVSQLPPEKIVAVDEAIRFALGLG
jgi:mRNA interferase MazF